jgi:hypothetical protein
VLLVGNWFHDLTTHFGSVYHSLWKCILLYRLMSGYRLSHLKSICSTVQYTTTRHKGREALKNIVSAH